MAKTLKAAAAVSLLLTLICALLHIKTANGILMTSAITLGTVAYHFCMRLLVSGIINSLLHNRVDYNKKWFQVGETEQVIYKKLNVKDWKDKMPTYDKSLFDNKKHSWDEIAQAMCRSEIVHETIVVLSFLPIVSAVWFGSLPVFIVTSALSACFDLVFVIMQRYNRPRVIKLIKRHGNTTFK